MGDNRRRIPSAKKPGGPRRYEIREVVNAVFYTSRGGCSWPMLPNDFPPGKVCMGTSGNGRKAVFGRGFMKSYVRKFQNRPEGIKNPIDSQSVKTTEKGGPKAMGKKIKGRKRHILVDTLGLIRSLSVQPADRPDRDGAKWVLQKVAVTATRLTLIWAEGGYAGKLIAWVKDIGGWRLEIVKRSDDVTGFKVVPKRWIVERTFAWLYGYRRLSKDYEYLVSSRENMIYIAMIQLMLRRLAMNST